MAKGKNTAQLCAELAQPLADELELLLWDVRFEKEGGTWFLRYFIDREGGVTIDDCERFSRAVDPLLDAADPIEQSYCLEVSSPGIERTLTKPWHFERYLGRPVLARLIRARGGLRELSGVLLSYRDGTAVLRTPDGEAAVSKGEAAHIRLIDDYDDKGEGQ